MGKPSKRIEDLVSRGNGGGTRKRWRVVCCTPVRGGFWASKDAFDEFLTWPLDFQAGVLLSALCRAIPPDYNDPGSALATMGNLCLKGLGSPVSDLEPKTQESVRDYALRLTQATQGVRTIVQSPAKGKKRNRERNEFLCQRVKEGRSYGQAGKDWVRYNKKQGKDVECPSYNLVSKIVKSKR